MTSVKLLLLTATFLLAGCLEDGSSLVLVPREPANCKEALNQVVQAERDYDAYLAGTGQVREAVLAANRLCGQ